MKPNTGHNEICHQAIKFEANWSGIISIDIIIEGDNPDEEAVHSATQTLQDEMGIYIKEAILDIMDGLPDGGEVQISDICVEPFRVIKNKELKNGD